MMAMVSAVATRVGESAFGHAWRKTGEVLDCVIPVALLIVIAGAVAALTFGFPQ